MAANVSSYGSASEMLHTHGNHDTARDDVR